MTTRTTARSTRHEARVMIGAARAAAARAANDNAGAAWTARDEAPDAHDLTHLATRVYGRHSREVYRTLTDEVEPRDWIVLLHAHGRLAVALSPNATRCRRTERVERVLRALIRAQGVECC